MFKILASLAAAATLFVAAPAANADEGFCYDAEDNSRICYRYMEDVDGELVVAIKQPGTYWPSAMHVICWEDGDVEYFGWGGLNTAETRATARAVCDIAYD